MKYLIVRKRSLDPFTEKVSACETGFELPFSFSSQELSYEDAADLRQDPSVDDLVPSMPFKLVAPLEDPSLAEAKNAWGVEAVGAACGLDGRGVKVAVLDTGIDVTHPAFAGLEFNSGNLVDFTNDEEGIPGAAVDHNGHGTHVAATIFGRDVEGMRIGVAPGIRDVLIGKVLGPEQSSTQAVVNGIEWALKRRADVICMSLGMDFPGLIAKLITEEGLPNDIAASRALEAFALNVRLFDRLAACVKNHVERGRGALLVAAAGNGSCREESKRYTVAAGLPAAAEGFISVGALSTSFTVAGFSNSGCQIAAPGVSILSARLGGGLTTKHGTSMATPHVAGVIALWTQKLFPNSERPKGWAKDVQLDVEANAVPIPGQHRNDVGRGLVHAPR